MSLGGNFFFIILNHLCKGAIQLQGRKQVLVDLLFGFMSCFPNLQVQTWQGLVLIALRSVTSVSNIKS